MENWFDYRTNTFYEIYKAKITLKNSGKHIIKTGSVYSIFHYLFPYLFILLYSTRRVLRFANLAQYKQNFIFHMDFNFFFFLCNRLLASRKYMFFQPSENKNI